jgi:hypothetical protein
LLDQFAADKDRIFRPVELVPGLTATGLSSKSVSPQLTLLRTHGNVRRVGKGTYQITPRGIAAHAKLIATEATEAVS